MAIKYALFDLRISGALAAIQAGGWTSDLLDASGNFSLSKKDGFSTELGFLASAEDCNQFLPDGKKMTFKAVLSLDQYKAIIDSASFYGVTESAFAASLVL